MKYIFGLTLFLLTTAAHAQTTNDSANVEIALSRDSLRHFFGTFEFTPQFKMRIFSQHAKIYAQRIGDVEKFQIFPKKSDVFFLKLMPAELRFQKSPTGVYETLTLIQGGKMMNAHRIEAQPYELYDTIYRLDSLLYAAYNARDLEKMMRFFSPNLEFYHDLTGKTDYQANFDRFFDNFQKSTNMRRTLLEGSLEVYPIKEVGAIQIGTHNFYQTEKGEKGEKGEQEKLVAQPKFIHIWTNTNNVWQITRIISYDH
jgi:ketosteroid isomerase-like protein